MEGKGWAGAWGDHVRAWDPLNRPNTLFLIRYEAMIEDPNAEASRIGAFLGSSVSDNTIPTFAALNAADPNFFRSGSQTIDPSEIPDEVSEAFWRRDGEVAALLGYAPLPDMAAAPAASDALVTRHDRQFWNESLPEAETKYLVYCSGIVGLSHILQSILNCMFLAHSTGRVLALDVRRFPFFAKERQAGFFSVFELQGPPDCDQVRSLM